MTKFWGIDWAFHHAELQRLEIPGLASAFAEASAKTARKAAPKVPTVRIQTAKTI
jgi:hypothetical protein